MAAARRSDDVPFFVLVSFIALAFLTGGSSRADTSSLLILLPAAALCCGIALWTLRLAHLAAFDAPVALLCTAIGLTAIHLVPLPSELWQALPGRALVTQHDALLGFDGIWRPLSLDPAGTRDVLYGLVVPSAVLLLGIQLGPRRLAQLLPVLLVLGCLSGLWAILQFAGGSNSVFYSYRVSSPDVATGAFANRNHQAVFLACLYPLLGAFAAAPSNNERESRNKDVVQGRRWGALGIAVFLLPLILVGGSRIGLVAAGLGMVAGAWFYVASVSRGRHGRRLPVRLRLGGGALALVAVLTMTLLTTRTASIDRLLQSSNTQELRYKVWPVIWQDIWRYFPAGSGIGSFMPVFQVVEPDAILRPTYLNHAHNEPFEIALTAGLPGVLLLVGAMATVAVWARRAIRRDGSWLARGGVIVIMLLVLGSLTDYPLRTPFLSCTLVIASLWAAARRSQVSAGPVGSAESA